MKKVIFTLVILLTQFILFSQNVTLLKDLAPGGANGCESETPIVKFNGQVFSGSTTDNSEYYPYYTDGDFIKVLGAKKIKSPQLFTVSGKVLYFFAFDVLSQKRALFSSDGTEQGTKKVKEINGDVIHTFPFNTNSILFTIENFSTNDFTLWSSDGTEAGTVKLGDFPFKKFFTYFSIFNNNVIISEQSTNTKKFDAVITNGTLSGTQSLKSFLANAIKFETIESVTSIDDRIFIEGKVKDANGVISTKKFITDGTTANTKSTTYSDFSAAFDVNNTIVVATRNYIGIYNKSNNSIENLALNIGNFSKPVANYNSIFYHDSDNYIWSANVASKKTKQISSISVGQFNFEPYLSVTGDSLFYTAYTNNGEDYRVINLKTSKDSLFSNFRTSTSVTLYPSMAFLSNQVIFTRITAAHGQELWTNNAKVTPLSATYNIDEKIKCNGGLAKVTINTTGGAKPYNYNWGVQGLNGPFVSLKAGNYTVTISDSKGETKLLNILINEPTPLKTSLTIQDPVGNQNNGQVALSVTGGTAPYDIVWNIFQTGATLSNVEAGKYIATITDFNGCKKLDTAIVKLVLPCPKPTAVFTQNINQNPMFVTNGLGNFTSSDLVNSSYFLFSPNNYRTVFFNTGLWVLGLDKTGNYKGVCGTYGKSIGDEFFAGILDENGQATMAKEFNKVWFVSRIDIEQHLADYADNKKIDRQIKTIYSWPGKGNPFFRQFNNFDLPDRDFAPFIDNNNDGIYDPSQGDYPLPSGIDKNAIPEMTTWTVFNDNAAECNHMVSKAKALSLEIHQTTWGFNTPNSNTLDHANFISYNIIYKGTENIDSTYLGIWSDPDIGCHTDDFVGCSPSKNAYFAYNQDEEDGNDLLQCAGDNPVWKKEEMPIASVKILNKKLDGFIYYNNSSVGTPNPATTDPAQTIDFYRYLNSLWKDGSPLKVVDFGYNPASTLPSVKYAFPGNPNDSTQWSMRMEASGTSSAYNSEARALGNLKIGTLKPNQSFKIDVAYNMHRKRNNTISQNLDLMNVALDSIQNAYNQGFKNIGTKKEYCKGNDCVYPGDANRDGIVNYKDVAVIANASRDTGAVRNENLIFAPLSAKNWIKSFKDATNYKHADATGDGIINTRDNALVKHFYNFTTPSFKKTNDVYAANGNDITIGLRNIANSTTLTTKIPMGLRLNFNFTEVNSLGFQLEIDSNYIKIDTLYSPAQFNTLGVIDLNKEANLFNIDLASGSWNPTLNFGLKFSYILAISGRQLTPIYPSRCTKIRFKNLVAYKKDGTPINLTAQDLELCFKDITTGNEDVVLPNPIQIMPNPFDAILMIKNYASEDIEVQLIDILGKVISQQKVGAESLLNLSTEHISNGVYFLKSSNGKQNWSTKVVKN